MALDKVALALAVQALNSGGGGGSGVAQESTCQEILSLLTNTGPKLYGFRVKQGDSDPVRRVEYLYDAVGMTQAQMDFAAGAFDYGSWEDIWFVKNNYACMVDSSGDEVYQLDPDDYTYRSDGTTASDIADTTTEYNAMSAIPLVWYRRFSGGGYYYFLCCEEQYDDSFVCDPFLDPDTGEVRDYKYVAMFKGSVVDGKLRSLSGLAPMYSCTAAQELAYAEAMGENFTLQEWGIRNLIQDLLVLIGGSTNTQGVFGQGHTSGGSSGSNLLTTGTLKDKGQFFGYSSTTAAMKAFHIENFWGDRWDRCMGIICDNNTYKAKMNAGEDDYNFTGDGYQSLGSSPSAGYITSLNGGRYGSVPSATGGSDSTYECDSYWISSSIVAVGIVGGPCNAGACCGARCLSLASAASYADWSLGGSLSLK